MVLTDFFACLVVVVKLIGQLCFYFIGVSVEGLGINKVMGLAINRVVLIGTNIIIGFFGLSL